MNFNKIEMELHEPYGVTLFEKMRAAAFNNGYFDHIDCPYLLTLDFRGYDNLGKPLSVITTRYLPIKITNVEMEINQGGTVYTMTGVPWTDFAMLDRYLYTRSASSLDLKRIFTLGAALNELSSKLNEQQELEIAAGQREYYDTYEIDCDPNTDLAGLTAAASNNWEWKNAVAGFNASIRPNISIAKVITDMCLKADRFRDISKIVEKYWKDLAAVQSAKVSQMEAQGQGEGQALDLVALFATHVLCFEATAQDWADELELVVIHSPLYYPQSHSQPQTQSQSHEFIIHNLQVL
jgi:hypothetical protein